MFQKVPPFLAWVTFHNSLMPGPESSEVPEAPESGPQEVSPLLEEVSPGRVPRWSVSQRGDYPLVLTLLSTVYTTSLLWSLG